MCVGMIGGVWASLYFTHRVEAVWLICAAVIFLLVCMKRHYWTVALCVVAGMIVGLWRGGDERHALQQWRSLQGKNITMSVTISEDVTRSRNGHTRVVANNIHVENQKLRGDMWVTLRTKKQLKRSDTLVLSGGVHQGFGSFVASMYEPTLVQHRESIDESRDARDMFASSIRRAIDEPFASLGIGFLVGQKSSLSPELEEQLRIVGLTHIIVASGYNLTILLRAARRIFAGISKYLTALSGGVLIAIFILMTGMSPSMTRAGMVAGLSLAAWYYGRHISPFLLLVLVAAISVIWKPMYLWADVGWYLSFTAFFGVMIVAPLLHDYFYGEEKASFVRQVIIETIAALAMTVPISLFVFQSYALYALPANVMIVPMVPYAMLLTFIAGLGSMVMPFAAQLFGMPAELLLQFMTNLVRWWAQQPDALSEAKVGIATIWVYYAALMLLVGYLWYVTKHSFRKDNIIE